MFTIPLHEGTQSHEKHHERFVAFLPSSKHVDCHLGHDRRPFRKIYTKQDYPCTANPIGMKAEIRMSMA